MLAAHLHAGSKFNAPTIANTETRKRFYYFVRRQEKENTINHMPLLNFSGRAHTIPAKTQRNKILGWGRKRETPA